MSLLGGLIPSFYLQTLQVTGTIPPFVLYLSLKFPVAILVVFEYKELGVPRGVGAWFSGYATVF